jgi:hypothetical protein
MTFSNSCCNASSGFSIQTKKKGRSIEVMDYIFRKQKIKIATTKNKRLRRKRKGVSVTLRFVKQESDEKQIPKH